MADIGCCWHTQLWDADVLVILLQSASWAVLMVTFPLAEEVLSPKGRGWYLFCLSGIFQSCVTTQSVSFLSSKGIKHGPQQMPPYQTLWISQNPHMLLAQSNYSGGESGNSTVPYSALYIPLVPTQYSVCSCIIFRNISSFTTSRDSCHAARNTEFLLWELTVTQRRDTVEASQEQNYKDNLAQRLCG